MMDYRQYASQYATQYGIPTGLFHALIQAESGWNPNAVSPAGAYGLGQLMPTTAQGMGIDYKNPLENLRGAAQYLSQQYKTFGDWRKALAAYNAGPGAVSKYGGIPPYKETQAYVNKIMGSLGSTPQGGPSGGHQSMVTGAGDPRRDAMRSIAFQDTPELAGLIASKEASDAASQIQYGAGPQGGNSQHRTSFGGGMGKFVVLPRRPGELGWQYLQRLGAYGGLRNDPGNGQTIGGTHAAGSPHYDGRAIDYGDARNSVQLLNQWVNFLNANYNTLGLQRVIWQQPGHYNHVDAATSWRVA